MFFKEQYHNLPMLDLTKLHREIQFYYCGQFSCLRVSKLTQSVKKRKEMIPLKLFRGHNKAMF